MINNKKISLSYWCITFLIIGFLQAMPVQAKSNHLPISVQLWSVKDILKQDFDGTIASLADMGFNGVEFAGDFGPYKDNPNQLKKMLASHNLVASSAHIGFESLSEATINHTLLFYKTLGVKILFVPWDERAWQPKGIDSLITQLSAVNDTALKFGMQVGFHNHNREFEQFNQATYWDYIASNTANALPLQLDIGWVHYAGKDPLYYITKYPKRTLATHLKVRTHEDDDLSPIFGENSFPWHKIIQSLITDGGTKWLVIEQEEYPNGLSPLQSVAKSKVNLDKILESMAK